MEKLKLSILRNYEEALKKEIEAGKKDPCGCRQWIEYGKRSSLKTLYLFEIEYDKTPFDEINKKYGVEV